MKRLLEMLLIELEAGNMNKDLCSTVRNMHVFHGLFTSQEEEDLRVYIKDNRPEPIGDENNYGWYWPPYLLEPRIEFIKKHIKLNYGT